MQAPGSTFSEYTTGDNGNHCQVFSLAQAESKRPIMLCLHAQEALSASMHMSLAQARQLRDSLSRAIAWNVSGEEPEPFETLKDLADSEVASKQIEADMEAHNG